MGNSINIPSPLPHFPIRPNVSALPVTCPLSSCQGSCCLNLLFIYLKAIRRLFYSQISVMCKCSASLQGNQWFLLRITPTQTIASCAIIILLGVLHLIYEKEMAHSWGKAANISYIRRCTSNIQRLNSYGLFIDSRPICCQPLLCNKKKKEKHY